jgi:branched-chain amino acid transport system substrate-binding protein
MKKSAIVIGAFASSLLLSACGGSGGSAGGGGEVVIGVVNPLTGPAAVYGEEAKIGFELALDEINARDGKCADGQRAKLLYEDDKGTPEGGVTAVQKLMTRERVNAITGGSNSSVVLAEASVTKDQIVQINTAAQADAITEDGGSMLFQINNTVTQNSKSFNEYLVNTLKPTSVAYMGEDTAFNSGVLDILTSDLAAGGITLVGAEKYQTDTNDFTPILNKLKSKNPDVLYIADAFPARTATLLQQVNQVGGFDKIVISPGVVTQGSIEASGKYMNGAITGEIYVSSIDTPANKRFVADFQEANPGKFPGKVEVLSYEAIYAICDAMQEAGSTTDQKAIAKAVDTLAIDTPRGTLEFGEKGRAIAPTFFIQEVNDGKLNVIDEVK